MVRYQPVDADMQREPSIRITRPLFFRTGPNKYLSRARLSTRVCGKGSAMQGYRRPRIVQLPPTHRLPQHRRLPHRLLSCGALLLRQCQKSGIFACIQWHREVKTAVPDSKILFVGTKADLRSSVNTTGRVDLAAREIEKNVKEELNAYYR